MRPAHLTPENVDLVPKHQDLHLLGLLRAKHEQQRFESRCRPQYRDGGMTKWPALGFKVDEGNC
jgi:hypothetical protein